ncbi:hypothetical protein OHJ21_13510 [Virgibacillus sp. LDC1]|jgi:hypothetical protein|nr:MULTISPECIES: hypothetical protein [Paenibacillus]MCV4232194.1 hypothetical protein [Virgibacillus sp. LDC1]MEC0257515.1 hypothetical protein [Paenibacillus lautus]MEC0308046.1 hypothetical protein [Paenibacillus lautus]PJN56179.1 hypothetical protein PAEVO_29020 [Paenibacillus sp. GM2FR]
MTEHRQQHEAKIEETKNTEAQFQTVDDILEYYGKRHKGMHDSKETVN